jgi:serine/threonine-protein kinase
MKRTVKNYEIRRVLGEGAMGMVYYALDLTLEREAALKSLRPDLAQQQKVIERFRAEAQTQAKLGHQNIATIYEYFQFGAEHFMAMEFINGKTLSVVLRERGRLPFQEAGGYIVQALRGLAHAHRNRVIHRDVKPANLMLNADGVLKVTDFGIARVVGADRATRVGMLLGTFEYISPEAVEGKDTTELSDLYSTGIVLFELLTGQLPFTGGSEYELVRKHVEADRPSLRDFGIKEVPSEFEAVIRRSMDRNARKRFRSADEMADVLQTCLDRERQRNTPGNSAWWRAWQRRQPGSLGSETATTSPVTAATAIPRRIDISTASRRVEDLLDRHLWDEANRVVEDIWRSHPDEPELVELRGRIQRQHQVYDQTVQQQVLLARELLERDLPEAALTVVDNALAQYARAAPLLDLKRECSRRIELRRQRAEEVAEIQRHVDELTAGGKYQEATDYILERRERATDKGELGSILGRVMQAHREYEKNQAILQVLSGARDLAGRQAWRDALSALDQAIEKYSRDARLTGLRGDLEEEWRAELVRQAVDAIIAGAGALELTSPEDARQEVASGLRQYPENAALTQELERLDAVLESRRRTQRLAAALDSASKLRRQRKWQEAVSLLDACIDRDGPDARIDELRELVAAEHQAHQAFLERFVTESRKLIEENAWEQAILKLSSAVREMPGEQVLVEMLQEGHQGLANRRRAETVARIKAQAESHAGSQDFDTAIQLLLDAVSQYPEDETLSTALSQSVFAREAFRAQQKIHSALGLAKEFWERHEHEEAIGLLRRSLAEVRDSAELLAKLEEYETEWTAIRRRRELDEIAAALEAGIRADDFKSALDRAAQGAGRYPGDKDVLELQSRVLAEQRRIDARRALAEALVSGARFEKIQSWDAAYQVYEKALENYPEIERKLRARMDHARAREAAVRRAERLVSVENRFHHSLDSGLPDEAEQVLNQALSEFGEEPAFQKWQDELAAARRLAARTAAIRQTAAAVAKLIERQEFDKADQVLSATEAEHGADPGLGSARDALLEAQETYTSTLESALKGIADLSGQGDFDAAIAAAATGQARFPGEPRFNELAGDAARRRDEENRKNHISQIQILLCKGAFDPAEVLVRYALNHYSNDPAFQELERELAAARLLQANLDKFAGHRVEVERLAHGRDWARAKDLIRPYLEMTEIQDEAHQTLARLDAEETAYRKRTGDIEKQARESIDAGRFEEAGSLLAGAQAEFPEINQFGALLRQARSALEIENEARLLEETERDVRDLASQNRFADALARLDLTRASGLGEARLRDLRTAVSASMREQERIAGIAGEVERLAGEQRGADAERALAEGLRAFPSNAKLEELRPVVDGARKDEREREARELSEAKRSLATGEIRNMIARRRYGPAAAALEALNREYGAEAGASMEKQLALARQADDRQVARLLTEIERLRSAGAWPRALAAFRDLPPWMAEDNSLAQARELVTREAEAKRLGDEEKRTAALRAAALNASKQERESIAAIADEVERLAQQQRGADADRALIDGLRRFPSNGTLQDLRPVVDAARKAEWEREAREASRNRETAEIERMIGQHQFRSAAAALEALSLEYGADAGADLAKQLELARHADDRQVARFLAKVERQRSAGAWPRALAMFRDLPPWMAEDIRVVDGRNLASCEAEAALALEKEQKEADQKAAELSASVQEQESIAAIADEVERLASQQRGADAERALIDGLRRFPSSSKLRDLRPSVDAARKAEWEREAREACCSREVAEIRRMVGEHQFRSAVAALDALNREYGAETGAELANELDVARQADEGRVAQFLEEADGLRAAGAWPRALAMFGDLPPWMADDTRLVDARDLLTRESEAARAREEEQRVVEERQRQAQEEADRQAAAIAASMQEQESIAAIADDVERLAIQLIGAEAERALIDGLRRFPGSSKLRDLQTAVDTARKAEWERGVREANRIRQTAELQRMIGQHQLRSAGAALEVLHREYGTEAGADLAIQLELARQADDQQVVRFLADVDRLRSARAWARALALFRDLPLWIAEDSRVAARRSLTASEAETQRAREEEQSLLDRRKREERQVAAQQAADMVASIQENEGIAAIAAEVNRCTGQGRWDDAERSLSEGLGRFPASAKLQELRVLIGAARKSSLERESREAGRQRDLAKIQLLIGQHHLRSAASALEAFNRDYGAEAGVELAKHLDLARQADDQQVSRFLADVDRLRFAGISTQAFALFRDLPPWMAEDSRVADLRGLVSREADAHHPSDESSPAAARQQSTTGGRKPWWKNLTHWTLGLAIVLTMGGFVAAHYLTKKPAPANPPPLSTQAPTPNSLSVSPPAPPVQIAHRPEPKAANTSENERVPQEKHRGDTARNTGGAGTADAGPRTAGLSKQADPSPKEVEPPPQISPQLSVSKAPEPGPIVPRSSPPPESTKIAEPELRVVAATPAKSQPLREILKKGTLVWEGKLQHNETFAIEKGEIFGKRVQITKVQPNFMQEIERPSESNHWGKLVLRNTGRKGDFTVLVDWQEMR